MYYQLEGIYQNSYMKGVYVEKIHSERAGLMSGNVTLVIGNLEAHHKAHLRRYIPSSTRLLVYVEDTPTGQLVARYADASGIERVCVSCGDTFSEDQLLKRYTSLLVAVDCVVALYHYDSRSLRTAVKYAKRMGKQAHTFNLAYTSDIPSLSKYRALLGRI